MSNPVDKPATWDDLKPGVRVKCIYQSGGYRYGELATIVSANKIDTIIIVKWDDKDTLYLSWSFPESFSVVASDTTITPPTETPTPIPTVLQVPTLQEPPFDFDSYNNLTPAQRRQKHQ